MKITQSRRRWWRRRRQFVGCAAQAGRRERSGSRPCRDGCGPRCQGDGPSAPPPAARLDPIEQDSAEMPDSRDHQCLSVVEVNDVA